MEDFTYKGHTLSITELPNFKNREDTIYEGTSLIDTKEWKRESSTIEFLIFWFKLKIDNLYKYMAYEDVVKEWKGSYKSILYKDNTLRITVIPHPKPKNRRAFYIGSYCVKDYLGNWQDSTIESIHYDKVVSRFQKFVGEYCTDWRPVNEWMSSSFPTYKGYNLVIKKEYNVVRYFGTCEIHKNSIFKCISGNVNEIEEKFKARIDRVVKEKERVQRKMLTPKQEKIQELEQLQARISAQLEELKKEKDTLEYKGVTLEITKKEDNRFEGIILSEVENLRTFDDLTITRVTKNFREYIDDLEETANLYCVLTGKEFYIHSSR